MRLQQFPNSESGLVYRILGTMNCRRYETTDTDDNLLLNEKNIISATYCQKKYFAPKLGEKTAQDI